MRPATRRAPSGAPSRTARAGSARPPLRHGSTAPPAQLSRNAAVQLSPTNSVASGAPSRARTPIAGTKRKERDFDLDVGEETNIHVVVRCRGRNDREVKENSGVVVSTEGARGTTVDLSMGPLALSNKTYRFDKVFSPAADQLMIYEDVVAPILDEMIAGYNCTIFAYGQTGTGKTYTMSGDMTDTLGLLSDAAGIIPRTLYSLFRKLEIEETEHTVKVSFIELYNEELRDLLASDDSTKLKLFEADQKKGNGATFVQGMEESHINSAQDGVRLLQEGSHKRQVAATRCNDLSSRSHTVFTVTVYSKRPSTTGEDWVVSGKLNLVDLAGSENIQRSGAENKRAAEAGLINKSLLTLGRVINALVDKGSHIPYRESKLTRLLQDSLGGRTKTCIIATISPAKSNLEETISTLDYAFRAKNIRNKPQINQPIQKKTLLREYTAEIQQLKSELIATRQRNGVYLSNDHYEQITVESESRRILSEEQKAKIETMESNLRNKVQDLFNLTNNLSNLKRDGETTRQQLEETNDILQQTEMVLNNTKQNLEDETTLRIAHQATEDELSRQGSRLLSTLDKTVADVNGLRAKIRRKSEIQGVNRDNWTSSQAQVSDVTSLVEGRVEEFQSSHEELLAGFASRFQNLMDTELQALADKERSLLGAADAFRTGETALTNQSVQSQSEMDTVLEEIKTLREEVKSKVGAGLQDLASAAGRISAGVVEELGTFHKQLNSSYRSLGKEMKGVFDEISKQIKAQQDQVLEQRISMKNAAERANNSAEDLCIELDRTLQEERAQAAADRTSLLLQITGLINAQGLTQDQRLGKQIGHLQEQITLSKEDMQEAKDGFENGMTNWDLQQEKLSTVVISSRDSLKKKLQTDWEIVEKHNNTIQATTKAIHGETVRIVDNQVANMAVQMQALDQFVTRAKSQNEKHHDAQAQLFGKLAGNVVETYESATTGITAFKETISGLKDEVVAHEWSANDLTVGLVSSVQQPLSELRSDIASTALAEYTSTGSTPAKINYEYPRVLARTAAHEVVLGKVVVEDPLILPVPDLLESSTPPSPSKADIYNDATDTVSTLAPRSVTEDSTTSSLRELPINIPNSSSNSSERENKTEDLGKLRLGLSSSLMGPPPLKRGMTTSDIGKQVVKNSRSGAGTSNGVGDGVKGRNHAEGRENLPLPGVVRLNASVGSGGRRLRSTASRQE